MRNAKFLSLISKISIILFFISTLVVINLPTSLPISILVPAGVIPLIFFIVMVTCFIKILILDQEKKSIIHNPDFHGHTPGIHQENEICVTSLGYPAPTAKVWIVSHKSIKIIDKRKNAVVPLSRIQQIELENKSNSVKVSCLALVETTLDSGDPSVQLEMTGLDTITEIEISKEYNELAQAIVNRFSENS